jgi:hypothetical protein
MSVTLAHQKSLLSQWLCGPQSQYGWAREPNNSYSFWESNSGLKSIASSLYWPGFWDCDRVRQESVKTLIADTGVPIFLSWAKWLSEWSNRITKSFSAGPCTKIVRFELLFKNWLYKKNPRMLCNSFSKFAVKRPKTFMLCTGVKSHNSDQGHA